FNVESLPMLLMPSKKFQPLLICSVFLILFVVFPVLCYGQAQSYSVSSFAGTGGTAGYAGDGGAASSAQLNFPLGITLANGNLYIADQLNRVVRAISLSSGTITTFAGNNTAGFSGDGAAANKAQMQSPSNIAVGSAGVYITDTGNNVVRLVNSSG